MNRHDGVSCDSCLKNNFRGRRYKCLICYDYDLCSTCFEAGTTTNQHTTEHPMQCILTKSDFDLYYGGEALGLEQPQSYTCPLCNKMGFTDATLVEHVTSEHPDSSVEVVCPICASTPGGEPNLVTDDFPGHLTVDHRTGPRDLISFLDVYDEPNAIRHGGVNRVPSAGRGRARRPNMQFRLVGSGSGGLSPSSREAVVDPIAELLSQLSGVRRAAAASAAAPSQLQQLQMQLQLERHQLTAARQQVERLPRRGGSSSNTGPAAPAPAARAEPSTVSTEPASLLTPYLETRSETGVDANRAALVRGLCAASLGKAPPARPVRPRPLPPPPTPAPPPRAKPDPAPAPPRATPAPPRATPAAQAHRQRNNKSPSNQ